jgi:hypothetical protein
LDIIWLHVVWFGGLNVLVQIDVATLQALAQVHNTIVLHIVLWFMFSLLFNIIHFFLVFLCTLIASLDHLVLFYSTNSRQKRGTLYFAGILLLLNTLLNFGLCFCNILGLVLHHAVKKAGLRSTYQCQGEQQSCSR